MTYEQNIKYIASAEDQYSKIAVM